MRGGAAVLAAAVLGLALTGLHMQTIDKGAASDIDEARQAVARTSGEWARLWKEHAGDRARPAIDFGRDMVVAVFLGTRPTAGYGVEVVDAAQDGGGIVVRYRETRPQPGMMTAQVLTSPYVIVAITKAPGDVRFETVE